VVSIRNYFKFDNLVTHNENQLKMDFLQNNLLIWNNINVDVFIRDILIIL